MPRLVLSCFPAFLSRSRCIIIVIAFLFFSGVIMSDRAMATRSRIIAAKPEQQPDRVSQTAAEATPLEPGKPIERELAGGQSHKYQVTLAAGQFLHVVAEQRGIDVEVVLFGPDGKELLKVDSPNGIQGPEPLWWVTESSGDYRLEIRSLEKDAKAGRYEVKIIALRVATDADRALVEALGLSREAEALRSQGKLAEAVSLAERALILRERALDPNHLSVADALNTLAGLYHDKGDYAKAEPAYLRSLKIREEVLGPNHLDVAQSLHDLAELYRETGDYAKAEPLFQRALVIWEKALPPDHPNVAATLGGLGLVYREKSDYAKAEPLFQRALVIQEQTLGSNHPLLATALNNLAVLYQDKGDYAKAESHYLRALAIREQKLPPNHPDIAQSLNNLAFLYFTKGDYVKAEPHYLRALSIWEQALGPSHPFLAVSLNNLAGLYHAKGDYAKAEQLYQRALEIRQQKLPPNHPDVAISLGNLAVLYRDKGDYAKVEPLYLRALEILEQAFGPNHPNVATALSSLAGLYQTQGDYAKAEPLYLRALETRQQKLPPNHPGVAISLNSLAGLYHAKGDYAKAEPLYLRALAIREQALGANHPDVVISLNNLAILYRDKKDLRQAISLAARAAEVSEFNLNRTLTIGSERQKLLFLALREREAGFILSLHAQFAPTDPQSLRLALTTLLRRKGRGLEAASDAIAVLRRGAKPEDLPLLDKFSDLSRQLATLSLRGPGRLNPDQYRSQLQQLEDESDKLDADLSRRSAEFQVRVQPATIESIQATIPRGAALVEFALYRGSDTKTNQKNGTLRCSAYVLDSQTPPRFADLGEAGPINEAIDALRQALREPKRRDVAQLARKVDELVMQPVRALVGKTKERLLISPDGMLNLLPFAALVDEQNQYLIQRYSISYLTSGRDLLRFQLPRTEKSPPLIVADPDFDLTSKATTVAMVQRTPGHNRGTLRGVKAGDESFNEWMADRLIDSAKEAEAIKTLWPQATVLLRDKATKEALKQVAAPNILHVATHGFFLEDIAPPRNNNGEIPASEIKDPLLRSGLLLAGFNLHKHDGDNGVLTAKEAAGLDLWGTKLVVLSACDTGIGDVKNGEGVYGLRRALVLAGSETQVMSLWPIYDYVSRELMTAYYTGLKQGQGRSEALRQVQLQMLKKRGREHPFYWASFIQSGEWANLEGKR